MLRPDAEGAQQWLASNWGQRKPIVCVSHVRARHFACHPSKASVAEALPGVEAGLVGWLVIEEGLGV